MKKKFLISASIILIVIVTAGIWTVNRNIKKAINTPLVSSEEKVGFEIKSGRSYSWERKLWN